MLILNPCEVSDIAFYHCKTTKDQKDIEGNMYIKLTVQGMFTLMGFYNIIKILVSAKMIQFNFNFFF